MATRSFVPALLALVSAGIMAGGASAAAQNLPYSIEVDGTAKTITPGGFAKFDITITNNSTSDLDMYVERVDASFPDENWYSSFCFNGACYDATVTSLPPAKLPAGGRTTLELTVVGGTSVNQTGTVKILTSNFLRSNSVVKEYEVTIANGAGVITERPSVTATAFPNPATSFTQIAIPASIKGTADVKAALFNARGEQVADLSDAARTAIESGSEQFRVDLAGLQSGAYYYTVSAGAKSASGSVMVVR